MATNLNAPKGFVIDAPPLPQGFKLDSNRSQASFIDNTQALESTLQDIPENQLSVAKDARKPSLGMQRAEMILQGASFGFSDELAGFIGSEEDMRRARERISIAQSERPLESAGLQIAGSIPTIGGLAKSSLGTGVGALRNILNPTTAKQAAGGAALLSGIYGVGEGEGLEERVAGGVQAAAIGGVLGFGTGKIIERFTKGTSIPNAEQISKAASKAYSEAAKKGGVFKNAVTNKFLQEAEKITPQTPAGKLLSGDNAVTKVVASLRQLKNRKITLAEAQEIDEFLGDAIDGFTEMGRLNKQGKKLLDVQTALRESLEGATESQIIGGKAGLEALKKGKQLWSKSAKLRDIEKIIIRAELTDNPASAIKSGFRTLLTNQKRMRGFSPEEREMIKKAATTGVVTDLFRTFGSRLIPIVTTASGAGGLTGSGAAAAATIASRGAASALQSAKAKDLANFVSLGGKPPTLAERITNTNLGQETSKILKNQKSGFSTDKDAKSLADILKGGQ